MADSAEEKDLFMSVRLDEDRRICKLSVSCQTTGQDVIELLKPDDNNVYNLVEIWKGCERTVSHEEKLKKVLLQWGSDVDDVVFMLKKKHSSSRQNHKQAKSSRNSPLPDQLQDKQRKVENLEKEVEQKEKHLKNLRNKESSKNSLKTKYVKLLETRVIEQEEKLLALQSVQDELFKTRIDNEKLVLELNRLRSLFVLKHQQLAEATARVELLSRELARSSQQNDISQEERNSQQSQYKSITQTDIYQKQLLKQQHLTEAQLLQLQANNGYPTNTLSQNGSLGKDILFLKHGIVKERGNLSSLLSWPNDDENDTETSADSGHVSNDSPPYRNKLDPNFQYFPDPPDMYCGKVERFGIDQEFGGQFKDNQEGLCEVDGWSKQQGRYPSDSLSNKKGTKGSFYNPSMKPPGNSDPTHQLFIKTDVKRGGVGSRQQQANRGSPQSISSLSSISSQSSRNEPQLSSFSGSRPFKMDPHASLSGNIMPQFMPSSDVRSIKSDSSSRSSTPTNERKPDNTSDACQKSSRNSGSKSNTPSTEYKPFITNESSSDTPNASRTTGSISHYHRNREGSLENSTPLTLGPFIEQSPSQTSDCSSENSVRRVRTPSLEKPALPKSLAIPKGNDPRNSHSSPTVSESANKDSNFNQVKTDLTTIKIGSMQKGGTVIQNGRSSPKVLDLKPQGTKNPMQQNINRKKSPLSADRKFPGLSDTKGRSSPAIFDPKSPTSDRIFDSTSRSSPKVVDPKSPTSDRGFDPKGRNSPRVPDTRVETSANGGKSKPDKGSSTELPTSSPAVQELLNDTTSLKVTAREVKPIQIQTRAEKDSDNIPVQKATFNTNASTADKKLPSNNQTKRVHKLPKPVPRKRTKTPPARGSRTDANVVVTPSQDTMATKSSDGGQNKDSKSQERITEQMKEGLGTKAYDSILRSSKNNRGKKSGKRVSLDPHAVLLHASLEGELELVQNIIHQVEDPSYPNNEGLTALHHAVCNSHDDIVKFLIEYGCDINASDMQGWTSLHCAAANNSVEMCKFLINHGACVFAVTAIEGKTPSRCCEKESENYEKCFTFLSDIENNFGIANEGVLYAVYAYQANRKDELSFECGERLTVVRRGDVNEKEWWWARDSRNQFGYIPRNLLGLHPPVAPDV